MLQLRNCPPESKAGLDAVLRGEYDIGDFDVGANPIILDIGANIGAFALWALHRYPGATVFCFEPHPESFKLLTENVADSGQVSCARCAVWLADGKARLFMPRPGGSLGEASLKDTGEVDLSRAGTVKVVHAGNLPEADVLKLDTEGCELDILKAYPHLHQVKAVMLEWHSHADRVAIRELMSKSGFTLLQDTEWHWAGRGLQKWVRLPRPVLFVAVLSGGGKVWAEHEQRMTALGHACAAAGIDLLVSKDSGTGVDRARNRAVASALAAPNVTHFMFIDDDIVFRPEWVVNMVRSDLEFVAGAYPRKQIDWELVGRAARNGVPDNELAGYSTSFIVNTLVDNNGGVNAIEKEGLGAFVEVEEIGTGFMMVKREVLEKLIASYDIAYITDYPPQGEIHHMVFACQRDPACELELAKTALLKAAENYWGGKGDLGDFNFAGKRYAEARAKGPTALGRYTTEDYSCCRLWRMLGGKVYCYIDAAVEHLGVMKFEGKIKNVLRKDVQGTDQSQAQSE